MAKGDMAKTDKRDAWVLNALEDWVKWSNQRKYYAKAPAQNILAQFIPQPSSVQREIKLSYESNAFNSAINGLSEDLILPFLVVYANLRDVIKLDQDNQAVMCQNYQGKWEYEYQHRKLEAFAIDSGVDKATFYRRADKAAAEIKRKTLALIKFYEDMQRECVAQKRDTLVVTKRR
jgi:hypothetical protein